MTKLQKGMIIFLWAFVIIMSTIIGYLIPKAGGDIKAFYTYFIPVVLLLTIKSTIGIRY